MRLDRPPLWAWPFAGVLLALPQLAWAGDEIRTSADVNVSGGYSNNPFSEFGGDTGSALVEINATPKIRLINEHSVLSLDGLVDYEHYFRLYSDKTDYRGTLDYLLTPSSRLSLHGNVYYDSAILGGLETQTPNDLTQPQTVATTGEDLGLYGTDERRRSFHAGGNTAYSLSDLSSLTANVYYDAVRYSGNSQSSNYDGYGGSLGYSRRFSEHLQLGLQASAARYVYQSNFGNAQVYSLQATFNNAFSEEWKLSGAIGGTYSDRTIGGKSTYLTGNVLLCRVSPRTSLCLNAGESVVPTGYTGTLETKTVGGSYSYQLTEHGKLSLSASYTHNDAPTIDLVGATDYVNSSVSYDRTLRERIHVIGTVRYRDLTGGGGNRPSDYGGTLGIAVKLGDYR